SLELPPGRYELRVSATSDRMGKGGSVYLEEDIPDLRSAPLSIGGLALTYADGARVAVAPPAVKRLASPLPFAPTLHRGFGGADTLRVYSEGVSKPPRVPGACESLAPATRRVLGVVPAVRPGDPLRVSDLVALRSLAPGAYILRATLTDGSHTATRDVGFV